MIVIPSLLVIALHRIATRKDFFCGADEDSAGREWIDVGFPVGILCRHIHALDGRREGRKAAAISRKAVS